ncbi:MAG: bacillithiol system redox-active protein YtxJ [Chitinophagales bacterium]
MSFLNKMFGTENSKKEEKNRLNWKTLASETDLNAAIDASNNKNIILFKHSTRCSISSMAKSRLERGWNISEAEADIYYLDLIQYRSVSNAIAANLDVVHQSPQVIVVRNGKAIYDASHSAIDAQSIKASLA